MMIYDEKREQYSSCILALLISSAMINCVIGFFTNTSARVGLYLMVFIWGLCVLYTIKYGCKVLTRWFYLLVYLLFLFLVSNMRSSGYVVNQTIEFIEYGLLGFYIGTMPVNARRTTKMACYILLVFAIPCFYVINGSHSNQYTSDIDMSASYAIIPIIYSCIFHFFRYKEDRNVFTTISSIIAFLLAINIVINGTRGGWICAAVFLVLMVLNSKGMTQKKKTILIVLGLSVLVFIIFNYKNLIYGLSELLGRKNISVYFVDKTLKLLSSQGDLSNGRLAIYETAFMGFLEKPLFGHGIGYFHDLYPVMNYPHNIILQLLYEGGLIGSFPLILLVISEIFTVFIGRISDQNVKDIVIITFSVSVPMLMVSSQLWGERMFWFVSAYMIYNVFNKKIS